MWGEINRRTIFNLQCMLNKVFIILFMQACSTKKLIRIKMPLTFLIYSNATVFKINPEAGAI